MDQAPFTFIGDIHYRDQYGQNLFARGAVFCENRIGFDEVLTSHLSAKKAHLLWTEEVFEVLEWLKKFGHNSSVVGLARRVNETNPVEMTDGKAEVGGEARFLQIDEIENVAPLDNQLGVYPKLTVPAVLKDAMFGQPAPTDAERAQYGDQFPPMGTYAILDAAKLPYVLTAYLDDSGLEYQSLFQGETQDELGDYAPYLVKLEEGNHFTRKLFTSEKAMGLYEKELGIFIRSRATLPELRKHFRKFTRVQDENGKWYYFRFWEIHSIKSYFSNLTTEFRRASIWFTFAKGKQLEILILSAPKLCRYKPTKDLQHEIMDRSFVFEEFERKIFSDQSINNFIEDLLAYLCERNRDYAMLKEDRKRDILASILSQAKSDAVTIEQAIADYAEAALLIQKPLSEELIAKRILTSNHHQLDRAKWVLQYCQAKKGLNNGTILK